MTESAENSEGGSPAPIAGVGAFITSVLVWISLRTMGVTTPWSAIRVRRKVEPTDTVDRKESVDPERALFVYKAGVSAQDHTDDKAKHLLALASSMAAFLVVFAPAVDPTWPGIVAVGALLVCVSLCVFLLSVRKQMQPTPEPLDDDPEGYTWAYDLRRSAAYNAQHHRFSVDLYGASRRWFFVALGSLSLILLLPRQADPDPIAASVDEASEAFREEMKAFRQQVNSLREELEAMRLHGERSSAASDSAE